MPAGIRVDSGISVGTTHWIERAVLRIGSDPQCDICLPSTELDAHALTLEAGMPAGAVICSGAHASRFPQQEELGRVCNHSPVLQAIY